MTLHRYQPLAAAIAVAAVLAGCGGGSHASSASSVSSVSRSGDHATPAQAQQDALNFSHCMRSHGVLNFPDPGSPEFKNAFMNSQSPAFKSADAACIHLMPGGGPPSQSAAQTQAHTDALLAFARCLRGHGFPSFPDPDSSGQLTHEMLANAGISLSQPAVLQAGDACVSVTHGVITKADVARFVAGH